MKSAADIWICNVCRSINPLKSNRCYRCHTPIELAAAKPEDLSVQQQPREAHTERVGTYRSTESLAVLVTVGAVAFILAGFLALWTTYTVNDLRVTDSRAAADALFQQRFLFLVPAPVIGVLALLAYAAWIRRAVEDLPALGLGTHRAELVRVHDLVQLVNGEAVEVAHASASQARPGVGYSGTVGSASAAGSGV